MSTSRDVEHRRKQLQELLEKGWKRQDIADKFGVHIQTVNADIAALKERYDKLVAENPNYLKKQLDKVFRFVDGFDYIIKQYYELKDNKDISFTEKRKLLDSIRQTKTEQAKILKLIGDTGNKYFQLNFIHVDQVTQKINLLIEHVVFIIKQFVVEDKQIEALQVLNNFAIEDKSKESND